MPDDLEGPEGAAVFPLIPEELGVNPLLLGMVHAYVFLEGSDEALVNAAAAEEAMEYLGTYLRRLRGEDLRRTKEDLQVLVDFAKSEKWPKEQVRFLKDFLEGDEGE
jgi:hypothetical protein